ncbi:MAG: DoxX family protein [Bacteroidales bacterium]|nr:DoxX family protein [Bacteroidales bacterium]
MKFIRNLFRWLLCITLICSGFFKLIDPVGTSLKIQEYFGAVGLSVADSVTLCLGIALATLEFTLGVCLLMRVKIKLVSSVTFLLILFFTIISFLLVIFNPIEDCGCFGDVIHLTNWQTLLKNVALLLFAYVTFRQGEKFDRITNNSLEWVFMGFFAAVAVTIGILTYFYSQHLDFTDYQRGTSLIQDTSVDPYISTFIYELDGIEQSFDINHLPDEKWTYIETKTVENPDYEKAPDFSVLDEDGNELRESILAMNNAVIISIYKPEKFEGWDVISDYGDQVSALGGNYIVLSSRVDENIPADFEYPVYFCDYKTLITLNRSNGGVVFIKKGIICDKLSFREIPPEESVTENILNEDEDSLVIKSRIRVRLATVEFLVVFIVVLYLMKNICRLTYRGYRRVKPTEE